MGAMDRMVGTEGTSCMGSLYLLISGSIVKPILDIVLYYTLDVCFLATFTILFEPVSLAGTLATLT